MMIKTKLYDNQLELLFDSFKHQYTLEGRVVPSVTQALSIIHKPALISWAANMAVDHISEQIDPGKVYDEIQLQTIFDAARKAHWQKKTDAANVGSFIHDWISKYIKGENPGVPVNDELRVAVTKFLGWVKENEVQFLASEQQVLSRKYGYTGTLDFICWYHKKLYIGDLKTSKAIYPEYFIQTAAYRQARSEEFPEENYEGQLILRIGKEGGFELARVADEPTYRKMLITFIAALKLYENMNILKEYKGEYL